jgi:lysophospholipase L1-like esterase
MVRRIVCVIVAVVTAVAALAVPASAADPDGARGTTRYYLALGDSLAFGFQPTRVTGQGYVDQLYASLHAQQPNLVLANVSCPGETSGTLVSGGRCPYPDGKTQLETALSFLRAHRGKVRLITIDIGGNDVNRCVTLATGIDQRCFNQALLGLALNLFRIVFELRRAAPEATIAGMTYYDTVLAAYLTGPAGQALARQSIPLSHEFNGLLSLIYRLGRFRVADVAGAFSTDDMTVQPNGLPLDVLRICQWTYMCAPAPLGPDIHANQAGYGVIAHAFEAVL